MNVRLLRLNNPSLSLRMRAHQLAITDRIVPFFFGVFSRWAGRIECISSNRLPGSFPRLLAIFYIHRLVRTISCFGLSPPDFPPTAEPSSLLIKASANHPTIDFEFDRVPGSSGLFEWRGTISAMRSRTEQYDGLCHGYPSMADDRVWNGYCKIFMM